MNRAIDRFLPPKKITQPEFWKGYKDDVRIRALRVQRCQSLQGISEELARKARELSTDSVAEVIQAYRKDCGLTREERYVPQEQRRYVA